MIGTYLNQTVQIRRKTGVDGYGKALYAAAVTAKARVEFKNRLVREAGGNQVVSSAQVYLMDACGAEDRVFLPDASERTVISIEEVPGLGGETLYRMVHLQ